MISISWFEYCPLCIIFFNQILTILAFPYSTPILTFICSILVSNLSQFVIFIFSISSIVRLFSLLLFSYPFSYPNIYSLVLISMLRSIFLVHLASRIFSILDGLGLCLHLELFILSLNVDFCNAGPLSRLRRIFLGILDNWNVLLSDDDVG